MPLPVRTLLAAALSALLLVTLPSGAGAASARTGADTRPGANGYSQAEARDVLHRAQRLMQPASSARGPRPAGADLTTALRDLPRARPALGSADRRTANRLLSRQTAAARTTANSAAGMSPAVLDPLLRALRQPDQGLLGEHDALHPGARVGARGAPDGPRADLRRGLGGRRRRPTPTTVWTSSSRTWATQGYYGYCTTEDDNGSTKVSAYCALDDDFAARQYGAPPLNSLRVTAAHEFFHAIQFAADVSEDIWFMEGSATWVEDVVYDNINDNYQYLNNSAITHPRTALDYPGGAYPYGSFIFFTYATAKRGPTAVRRFWDAAVGAAHLAPGDLGRGRRSVLAGLRGDLRQLEHAAAAQLPGAGRLPEARVVAAPDTDAACDHDRVAPRRARGTSAARPVLLSPARNLPVRKKLLINIDAPPRVSGAAALLQRRYRSGKVTHTMIRLGPQRQRQHARAVQPQGAQLGRDRAREHEPFRPGPGLQGAGQPEVGAGTNPAVRRCTGQPMPCRQPRRTRRADPERLHRHHHHRRRAAAGELRGQGGAGRQHGLAVRLHPAVRGAREAAPEYADQGLVVLGFPCNQFGNQDPGDNAEIGAFCEKNYGVSFPMFEKVDVNGDDAHPLFQWLREEKGGVLGDKIKWNFTKFLVGRDGTVHQALRVDHQAGEDRLRHREGTRAA